MNLYRIDLRLKPSANGEHELKHWPDEQFSPDFIVAASGVGRFELDSKVVGVTMEGQHPTATSTDHLNTKQVNYWLPDYTGGFAYNLGNEVLRLKQGRAEKVTVRFMDEPLELQIKHEADEEESYMVSFVHDGHRLVDAHVPAALLYAETGRCLQDFIVQLLSHNVRLGEQPDVAHLRRLVSQIVV